MGGVGCGWGVERRGVQIGRVGAKGRGDTVEAVHERLFCVIPFVWPTAHVRVSLPTPHQARCVVSSIVCSSARACLSHTSSLADGNPHEVGPRRPTPARGMPHLGFRPFIPTNRRFGGRRPDGLLNVGDLLDSIPFSDFDAGGEGCFASGVVVGCLGLGRGCLRKSSGSRPHELFERRYITRNHFPPRLPADAPL